MASAGSIFVDLLLKDSQYVSGIKRARATTKSEFGGIRADIDKTKNAFAGVISPVNNVASSITRLSGVLAGALSVQKIVAYSDAWKSLESRLNLVTGSAERTAEVQERLFNIAQDTAQPLNETIAAYTRLSNSLKDAQKQQFDLTRLTELLSKTLVLSGTNAAGAATFFQQFGQAASSDFKAIGQELQTFADQNPALYKILSDEANKYGKTLKQMGADGELSFDFVAKAVLNAGKTIDEQAEQISLTVGRAFTNLDNAFLKFIGESDAVASGTSSLALAINSLAQNLDLVANAAVAVSVIFAGRLIGTMSAAALTFLKTAREAAAVQLALAGMEGISRGAAQGMILATGAARGLSAALSAVGGPVGLAVIATFGLINTESRKVKEAQDAHNNTLLRLQEINGEVIGASKERVKQLVAEKTAILDAAKAELVKYETQLLTATASRNRTEEGTLARFFQEGVVDTAISNFEEASQRLADIQKQIEAIEKNAPKDSGGGNGVISESAAKKAAKAQRELEALYERNRSVITGVTKEAIEYNKTLDELNILKEKNLITDEQLIEAVGRLTKEYNENQEEVSIWGEDLSAISKRAAENMQDAFADFLFDPFQDGLDGMLKGFVDTMRRMIAEDNSRELFKAFKEIGGFEGVFSKLFGSSPAAGAQGPSSPGLLGEFFGGWFADGGYLEPGKWGIAGEEGAELIYGGRSGKTIIPQDKMGGGNTYQIDARGADMAAVRRIEKSLLLLAGPGVTEQRVSNAQVRGMV